MSAGKKIRNSQVLDGRSFMDEFNISLAAAEKLENVLIISGANNDKVLAWYNSSDPITESDYNGFPKGSIIFDMQSTTFKIKTGDRGSAGWDDAAAS